MAEQFDFAYATTPRTSDNHNHAATFFSISVSKLRSYQKQGAHFYLDGLYKRKIFSGKIFSETQKTLNRGQAGYSAPPIQKGTFREHFSFD